MPSSVNLGERLDAWISEAVRNGRYGSRSEVLREGVRLVQEREARWAREGGPMQSSLTSPAANGQEEAPPPQAG